jgi:hypothetical protein
VPIPPTSVIVVQVSFTRVFGKTGTIVTIAICLSLVNVTTIFPVGADDAREQLPSFIATAVSAMPAA